MVTRFCARLLTASTDATLADSILGDLEEERGRRARRSRIGATVWMVGATIGIVVTTVVGRLKTAARITFGRRGRSNLPRELRQATRALRSAPWFSGTVIGVVALTMSMAATVFALVDGVLFKPLPYRDADQLVAIRGSHSDPAILGTRSAKATELDAWQRAIPDVEFAGFAWSEGLGVEQANESPVGVGLVHPGFFETVGIRPLIGGFGAPASEAAAGVVPAIVSYDYWQRRLGGRTDVVGTDLPGDPRIRIRVAGVMPPGFQLPDSRRADLIVPAFGPLARPTQMSLRVIARLPQGMSPDELRGRLETVWAHLRETETVLPNQRPFERHPDRAAVIPLGEAMAEPAETLSWALFGAMLVLALIACVNVSGLMAVRSLDRSRDLALRRAIGAGWGDIARGILIEHGLLFTAGAAIGLAAASPLLQITLSVMPERMHFLTTPAINLRTMGFALIATITLIAGAIIWPLVRALSGRGPSVWNSAQTTTPRTRSTGRFTIISTQVACAVLLVVAGALVVGSLLRVWQNRSGFDLSNMLIVELAIPSATTAEAATRALGFAERVRRMPGVSAAAVADGRVLDRSTQFGVGTFSLPDGTDHVSGLLGVPVTSGFFRAAGIHLLEGRFPSDEELDRGARVAAISRALASTMWPGQSPVGRSLKGKDGLYEIVGLVGDIRLVGWDSEISKALYLPYTTFHFGRSPSVLVRTLGAPAVVLKDILALAEGERPHLRATRAQTTAAMLADTVRERRFRSWLFGSFAVVGLVLVMVGILGLVAMNTARRTREIGIRMALGAQGGDVVRSLMREQLSPVVAGLILGCVASTWAVGLLESYLYELTTSDLRVWSVAILVVLLATLAGGVIPSLRASRIDPVLALRSE